MEAEKREGKQEVDERKDERRMMRGKKKDVEEWMKDEEKKEERKKKGKKEKKEEETTEEVKLESPGVSQDQREGYPAIRFRFADGHDQHEEFRQDFHDSEENAQGSDSDRWFFGGLGKVVLGFLGC